MASPMEKLLGVKVGYDRTLAGTVAVPGKEFVYYSDDGRQSKRKQFDALTQYVDPPYAEGGGAASQPWTITLPDGSIFHGISYSGDLEGWRRDIEEGAQALGVRLGRIQGDLFVISDGRSFALADCQAVFG
jgi:hypothetical protein